MQAQVGVFGTQRGPNRAGPQGWADAPSDPPVQGSRALVPIQPTDGSVCYHPPRYPSATFLAHLIAVDRRAPQMRARGRAAPEDAAAIYSATLAAEPAGTGRRVRRSA